MRPDREWWQAMPREDYLKRIGNMPLKELEVLSTTIGATMQRIQGQQSMENPDADWHSRARFAKAIMAERRGLVKAELQRRRLASTAHNEQQREKQRTRSVLRRTMIQAARNHLASGDTAEALETILDLLEGVYVEQETPPAERTSDE